MIRHSLLLITLLSVNFIKKNPNVYTFMEIIRFEVFEFMESPFSFLVAGD